MNRLVLKTSGSLALLFALLGTLRNFFLIEAPPCLLRLVEGLARTAFHFEPLDSSAQSSVTYMMGPNIDPYGNERAVTMIAGATEHSYPSLAEEYYSFRS
jgi:hypothetical protein